jgi:2-methylisocitrate lyase-like PEP mutase family enzyme
MDNNKLEMLNGQRAVKELKEQGFKFIIMPGYNRSVDPKHVRNLIKSVREKGFFLNSIKFISAEVWFQFYPERRITL